LQRLGYESPDEGRIRDDCEDGQSWLSERKNKATLLTAIYHPHNGVLLQFF